MTRIWLTMALAVLAGAAASATSGDAVQAAESATERELRQLNRAAAEMQVRKDADAAERLLADDYVFLQADGNVSNKAQNIAILRDPAFVCESLTTEDVVVRVYGNVGVITGRAIMRATYRGQDVGGEFLYTDVWVKRGGRWQTVGLQATLRPRRP